MAIKPVDLAESILKCVEKRDWADYQRYLSGEGPKLNQGPQEKPMNYQEFRTRDELHKPKRFGR
jgi:hypothetical protein